MPVKAKNFAWSCIGSQAIGSGLRITGTQEPGADIVKIRNSSDGIVMTLAAVGPVTEEVISNVGRNGEDGIIRKRVYADNDGKRWIYKNLDAHPSFQSAENSKLYISCFPWFTATAVKSRNKANSKRFQGNINTWFPKRLRRWSKAQWMVQWFQADWYPREADPATLSESATKDTDFLTIKNNFSIPYIFGLSYLLADTIYFDLAHFWVNWITINISFSGTRRD